MSPDYTKLESETRDKKKLNLCESLGVAVREMDTDTDPADQSACYVASNAKHIERWVWADPLSLYLLCPRF